MHLKERIKVKEQTKQQVKCPSVAHDNDLVESGFQGEGEETDLMDVWGDSS